jgi:hypothetical protein
MSVIPVTQEAENRRIMVQNQPRQTVRETLSQKKKHYKRGLVEWFKVQTLSSSPSTGKKKKKKEDLYLESLLQIAKPEIL